MRAHSGACASSFVSPPPYCLLPSGSPFSASMLLALTSAATAPTAASQGASKTPATPMVNGSSNTVCSPCLMLIRRTFPSLISRLVSASSRSPSTLNSSVRVCSCVGVAMGNLLSNRVIDSFTTQYQTLLYVLSPLPFPLRSTTWNAFPAYCSFRFSRPPPAAPRQRFPASPERHFRHQRRGRCPLS